MLLVEDMPGRRARPARQRDLPHAPADLEDTLAQLIHDENQVVRRGRPARRRARLWSLADDLEHVLAHRDAKDWHVFEAASWALAAARMPADRRRQLQEEPLPTVVLVDTLRRSLFDFTYVDELFRIVGLGGQVRHEAGRTPYARGLHRRRSSSCSMAAWRSPVSPAHRTRGRPRAAGLRGNSRGPPERARPVRALEPTICLSIPTEAFLSLMAENVELAEGIMRCAGDLRHALNAGH